MYVRCMVYTQWRYMFHSPHTVINSRSNLTRWWYLWEVFWVKLCMVCVCNTVCVLRSLWRSNMLHNCELQKAPHTYTTPNRISRRDIQSTVMFFFLFVLFVTLSSSSTSQHIHYNWNWKFFSFGFSLSLSLTHSSLSFCIFSSTIVLFL